MGIHDDAWFGFRSASAQIFEFCSFPRENIINTRARLSAYARHLRRRSTASNKMTNAHA